MNPILISFLVPILALLHSAPARAGDIYNTLQRYEWRSGPVVFNGAPGQAAASQRVKFSGAVGLRVHFERANLGQGAVIRVSSNRGRQILRLDDRILRAYNYSTPYLNGDQALVELMLPAGGRSPGIAIRGVEVVSVRPGPESLCGSDDRVPSKIPAVARMMEVATGPAGCTGTLISNSCMVSAGHCVSYLNIGQFNVPPSNENGTVNFPPAEDQYPLAKIYGSKDGGPGNDWSVYRVAANPITGKFAGKAQGYYRIGGNVVPAPGSIVRITGYGSSTAKFNYSQQTHAGPVIRNTGPQLEYTVDTMPGNSGSSVILESTQEVIGIHTHGGCAGSGTGNSATLLALSPDFQKAIQQCLADDAREKR